MKKSIKVLFMFFGLICFRTDRIVAMMEAIDEYEDETSSDDLTGSGETSSTSSTGNSDPVTTTTTLTNDAKQGYDDYINNLEENGKTNSMTDEEIAQYYEDYLQTLETQTNSSSSTVTTSSTGGAGSAGSSTPTIGVNTGLTLDFNAPSSPPTTTAPSAPASSGGGLSFDLTDSESNTTDTTDESLVSGSGSSSTTSASGTSAVQTFAEYLESRAPGATLQSTVTTSGANSSVTLSLEAESTSTDTQNTDTATRTGSSSDSGSVTIDTEDDQDDSQPVLFDDDDDTDGITNSGSAATLVETNSETGTTTTTDNDAPASDSTNTDDDAPAVEAPSAEGKADEFEDVNLNDAIAEVIKNPSEQAVINAVDALKSVISNQTLDPLEALQKFFVALGAVLESVMQFIGNAISALDDPYLADAYNTLAEEDESLQPATSDSDSETSDANIDETIKPTDSTTDSTTDDSELPVEPADYDYTAQPDSAAADSTRAPLTEAQIATAYEEYNDYITNAYAEGTTPTSAGSAEIVEELYQDYLEALDLQTEHPELQLTTAQTFADYLQEIDPASNGDVDNNNDSTAQPDSAVADSTRAPLTEAQIATAYEEYNDYITNAYAEGTTPTSAGSAESIVELYQDYLETLDSQEQDPELQFPPNQTFAEYLQEIDPASNVDAETDNTSTTPEIDPSSSNDSSTETSSSDTDEESTDSTTENLLLDEDGNIIVDFSTGTAYDDEGFGYQLGALAETLSMDSTQAEVEDAINTLQEMKSSSSTTTNKVATFLADLGGNVTDLFNGKMGTFDDFDTPDSLYDEDDDDDSYDSNETDDNDSNDDTDSQTQQSTPSLDTDSQTQQSTPSLIQEVQTAINSNATLTTEIASESSSTPSLSFDRQSQVESAALIYDPTSPDYDSAANVETAKAFLGITDSEFTITDVENAVNDPSLQKYLVDTFVEYSDATPFEKLQAVVDILNNSLTGERIAGGTEVEVEVDDDDDAEDTQTTTNASSDYTSSGYDPTYDPTTI